MSDISNHNLRLWSADESAAGARAPIQPGSWFKNINASFESLTGWILAFDESRSSVQHRQKNGLGPEDATGKLVVDDLAESVGPARKALDRNSCQRLADGISSLVESLQTCRTQLRAAQTELATCVPASLPADESGRLEHLVRQLMTTATEQFGFRSASLWLIDDDTHCLNQRFATGPDFPSLIGQRHLGDSRADVRSMTGNVIVMNDINETAHWQAPVRCESAICLPVSSMSNLYGTIWLVAGDGSPVSDRDSCLLEVIAGRIACELERTGLARKLSQQQSVGIETEDDSECVSHEPELPIESQGEFELIQPPFHGWHIEAAGNGDPEQACFRQRWTGYRITAAETMMILSVHVGAEWAKRKISTIRSAFDAFCSLPVSPATIIDGAFRIIQQRFDGYEDVSLCCIEIDPLTGEYRWVSRGADWGSLANPLQQESEMSRASGAAILQRQSELKLSVPDAREIWRPSLTVRRTS